MSLEYMERGTLQTRVLTHYYSRSPWSGFPYYKLTTPRREGFRYPLPGEVLYYSVSFNPRNIHQYPVDVLEYIK